MEVSQELLDIIVEEKKDCLMKDNLRDFRFISHLNDTKTDLKSWVKNENSKFSENGFDAWISR